MHLDPGIVVIGAITGLAYGMLAMGLILVYRSSRIVNFAHGAIGAFSVSVLALLVLDWRWNFALAALVAVAAGGAVGAVWERLVIRRVANASRLILLVMTIGIAQVMLALQLALPELHHPGRYPTAFNVRISLFGAVLGGAHITLILVAPVIVGGLAWLLNRTTFGLSVRASASSIDNARLAGIRVRRVSTAVWALAGVLSAVTFILVEPVRGDLAGSAASATLGPGLLLRALVAAVVGGFVSFPAALVGGVAVGVGEALLFANIHNPGTVDGLLAVALVALVAVRGARTLTDDADQWSLAARRVVGPKVLRHTRWVGVAVAVVAPLVLARSSQQFTLTLIVLYALAGVSVVLCVGWAGQLSLAQFAFVGIGAAVTAGLTERGMSLLFSIVYATVAGVVAAVAVGWPALRVRGMLLAVTTLGLSLAASSWVVPTLLTFHGSQAAFVTRGRLGPIDVSGDRAYYYVCLGVLVAVLLAVSRLRTTGVGRAIVAVRDNERSAASHGVVPAAAKLRAFALAGGTAALAGGLLAGAYLQFRADAFPPDSSLRLLSMVVIGGAGSVAGAVAGAVYIIGVPALTGGFMDHLLGSSSVYVTLLGGVGVIMLLLQNPAGLVQSLSDLVGKLIGRRGTDAIVDSTPRRTLRPIAAPVQVAGVDPLLVDGVTVAFGGIVANHEVSLAVHPGEIVGLIGTNGAGKSTLMQAIGGFAPIEAGTIHVFGTNVARLSAPERAALGLGRVFQDARLYPDLTVAETVAVALESRERSELIPSLLALPPSRRAERRKRQEADDLLDGFGLGRYAGTCVGELSTGTRRFVELACLVATQSRLLLLDEPTAGIAQREVEQFAPFIAEVRAALSASVLLIEHDMPVLMSLCHRIYCLSAGEVIAEGTPNEVRNDERVIASYLGTEDRALTRSDVA